MCLRFSFLGASAKLRKATIDFVMSGCLLPSVRMYQLGPYWTDFYDVLCWRTFLKYVVKIQALL